MPPQLTWKEAIKTVLRDAKEPLRADEIVQEIKHRGLRSEFGATPPATVGAQIYTSINNDGAESPFVRPVPGRFALRDQSSFIESSTAPKDLSEKEPQEGTSQVSGVLNAIGMFWDREKVDWKSSQPKLLGHLPSGTDVDFNPQRGIYLLHDSQGVVYAGRVTDQDLGSRLRQHTTDRLNGRWDRFSWFGIYPVTENGTLKIDADFSKLSVNFVIIAMEAILIEALEPRQNRKRGDANFDAIEFLQSEDPKFVRNRKLAIIDEVRGDLESSSLQ